MPKIDIISNNSINDNTSKANNREIKSSSIFMKSQELQKKSARERKEKEKQKCVKKGKIMRKNQVTNDKMPCLARFPISHVKCLNNCGLFFAHIV